MRKFIINHRKLRINNHWRHFTFKDLFEFDFEIFHIIEFFHFRLELCGVHIFYVSIPKHFLLEDCYFAVLGLGIGITSKDY